MNAVPSRFVPSDVKAKAAHVWARDPYEWYQEPPEATRALLSVEAFVGRTVDPCCGGGNIPATMRAAGLDCIGSDLVRRAAGRDPWWVGEADFLTSSALSDGAANVVMNPPYFRARGTEDFIRHALALASGKVAAFVDLRFLASRRRAEGLYAEHPPHRIWMLGQRPSCPPGEYLAAGNVAGGGTADFVWLVWDQAAPRATESRFGWIGGPAARAGGGRG